MEVNNVQNDFNWVVKTLESCVTSEQLTVTLKLYENFLKKWDNNLSKEMKLKLTSIFDRLVLFHKVKIKKKLTSNIRYN